ncbi:restriction endonuclease subunit S [Raoultella planticola]|uniref:restriction endonuclease subunit S n=1 Tax=Raoultella planticola TaxID=575 RepID=UPI0015D55547|nr:restriction endonuclease subunit S [Raoultella planticola]
MVFEGSVPNGWKLVKLSDLGEVNRGKSKHRPRDAAFLYGGSYPFIQTGDVKASEGRITSYNQTYSEAGLKQSRLWPSETMCITIAANIAETGILTFPACFPDSIIGFIADKKQCDVYFIEYLFRLLKKRIQAQANGSVQDNINLQTLERIIFPVPEIRIQKNISNFLKKLDDKIILNKETNQTLEQMSQTLFKSWFVDFDPVIDNALDAGNPIPETLQSRAELRQKVRNSADFKPLPADIRALFPAEFEETESGCLPAKWIYSDLSKLIDIKHGYAYKGEYFSEKPTDDILLTPGNVRIGGGFKLDKFKYYDGEIPKDYIFEKDDIFVSMTDLSKECDSLGYAARIPYQENVRFLHNQRLGRVIISKHNSSAKEFIYQVLISQDYRNTVLGSVTGTTVKHTSPRKILSHVIPHSINGEVEKKFDSICSSYSLSISKNNENNRILLQLRDTLLPKLISGELSLEDLPNLVAQTEPA